MAQKLSTPAPLFPWDGGFDLDDLAKLTHKAHHPELYKGSFATEKGETEVPKAYAKPNIAFKEKRTTHFTFIDLFAGIGGFRVAGQNVGGSCVFTSEWDKYARRAYFMNFGQVPFGDITKFTESEVALKTVPKHDVLCGGFPCQAFSISGKQEGFKDPRGTLFFEIYKIAKQHRPAVLFLENVKNFARHDGGNTFKTIRHHLEKKMAQETKESEGGPVSYRVSSAVLNASDFGASTKRERIYIVAVREDLADDVFKWTEWVDLLENLPQRREFTKKFLWQDIQPKGEIDRALLEKVTIKRNDFRPKLTEDRDDIKLKDQEVEEDNKPIRIGVMGKGGQGERIYSTHGHAITFSAYGGGAASKTGAYYVDGRVRKLTPAECASAMGFHGMDVSTGDVPLLQRYKQFGNSVVVNVVEAIFSEIQRYWLPKPKNSKRR
jgi:DNA (cytosine-5)-methyltransferase 1